MGDVLPFSWSLIRWNITAAIKTNGIRKCKVKNRIRVASLTLNPPHNHCTIEFPKYGMADTKLVITVAPQKDICPHGNTYPKKAVPIKINKIITPDVHVFHLLKDEKRIPRLM
jgi:hypothetical protein